jgi:hypothetical protein
LIEEEVTIDGLTKNYPPWLTPKAPVEGTAEDETSGAKDVFEG